MASMGLLKHKKSRNTLAAEPTPRSSRPSKPDPRAKSTATKHNKKEPEQAAFSRACVAPAPTATTLANGKRHSKRLKPGMRHKQDIGNCHHLPSPALPRPNRGCTEAHATRGGSSERAWEHGSSADRHALSAIHTTSRPHSAGVGRRPSLMPEQPPDKPKKTCAVPFDVGPTIGKGACTTDVGNGEPCIARSRPASAEGYLSSRTKSSKGGGHQSFNRGQVLQTVLWNQQHRKDGRNRGRGRSNSKQPAGPDSTNQNTNSSQKKAADVAVSDIRFMSVGAVHKAYKGHRLAAVQAQDPQTAAAVRAARAENVLRRCPVDSTEIHSASSLPVPDAGAGRKATSTNRNVRGQRGDRARPASAPLGRHRSVEACLGVNNGGNSHANADRCV